METRKRPSARENYIANLDETPAKRNKEVDFYARLNAFYRKKWNIRFRAPTVQGVEVDLFKLYDVVRGMGGWQKVAMQERWFDVAEAMGVPEDCSGSEYAIKIMYMRYLSKFEQSETTGDIDDMMEMSEFSRSARNRMYSFFATSDCPLSSNIKKQPIISSHEADYGRLMRALLSGLPNEIDFALNICSIISAPGHHVMRVSKAPELLSILCAVAGVFDEYENDLVKLHESSWRVNGEDSKFYRFWANSGLGLDELEILVPQALKFPKRDDFGLFAGINHDFSCRDPISWRVQQIAVMLRSLSFEPFNKHPLAHHWPVMKFLMACANCEHTALFTLALDTLGNIGCEIDLTWERLQFCWRHLFMETVRRGIFSTDKFKVVRALEILGALATHEHNEIILAEFLTAELLRRVVEIMTIKDIMLAVYTLECLYQISEMGPSSCEPLACVPYIIDTLITLATIEAVSYGKDGLIGMKVVEYHSAHAGPAGPMPPGQASQQHPHHPGQPRPHPAHHIVQQPHPQAQGSMQQQGYAHQQMQRGMPQFHGAQKVLDKQPPPRPITTVVINRPNPPSTIPQGAPLLQRATLPPIHPPTNVPDHVPTGNFNCEKNIERLTFNWIRQNCVQIGSHHQFQMNAWTSRSELYSAYVDDLRNHHQSLSVSLVTFSQIMGVVFPEATFKMSESTQTPLMAALGVRLAKPHPLVGQQGCIGTLPPGSSTPTTAAAAYPLMQQMLKQNTVPTSPKPTPPPVSAPSPAPAPPASSSPTPAQPEKSEKPEKAAENPEKTEQPEQPAKENSEDKPEESPSAEVKPEPPATPEVKEKVIETRRTSARKKKEEERKEALAKAAKEERASAPSTPAPAAAPAPPAAPAPAPQRPAQPAKPTGDLMCEWDGCGELFFTPAQVVNHLIKKHLPPDDGSLSVCKWPNCDGTERSKWSLVTHIQDHHASEAHLKSIAAKRRDGAIPRTPIKYRTDVVRELPPHPGYSRNAAIEAIGRHAFKFLPRDVTDEPEGPVTRSIRLTACLILRNLSRYSSEGRQRLRRHERTLCWIALSRLEGSMALAQLLSELHPAGVVDQDDAEMHPDNGGPASVQRSNSSGSVQG